MPRARNIKPGFFTNDELVELPMATRLLFIGLWTIADREGRLEDRPKKIKMEVFPADDVDVDEALSTLVNSAFIQRYQVDEARYIQITNFTKHQRPHSNETASVIPPPNNRSRRTTPKKAHESGQNQETVNHGEKGGAPKSKALRPDTGYLDTDSLIPDSGLSDCGVADADAPGSPDIHDEPEVIEPPKRMPRNGDAQRLLATLHEDILGIGPPTKFGQAVKQADDLVKAGCTVNELQEIVAWLLRDPWHASKGITIATVLQQRDKWLSSQSQVAKVTHLAPPRRPEERIGKDGLTDAERGWRENPGHKGWSADEMMRMSLAMEQQERDERNSA